MSDSSGPNVGVEIVIIFLLIIANAVFAMCEMAIVSSRKSKLEHMARQGDKGAQAALELAENPSRMLSSIQTGITVIGILTGAVGGGELGSGSFGVAGSNYLASSLAGDFELWSCGSCNYISVFDYW